MPASPQFTQQLAGKRYVVFGGTSGIGFAVASALIEEGAIVVISSSNPTKVETTIGRLNDPEQQYNADPKRVFGRAANLAGSQVEGELQKFFKEVGGQFDGIIWTAGDNRPIKNFIEQTFESLVNTGSVRFFSPILAIKTAINGSYIKRGGSIILTGGIAADTASPDWAVVSAYSGALNSLTQSLASDLSAYDVRLNQVAPGAVLTELWDTLSKEHHDFATQKFTAQSLTGRLGTPREVANSYIGLLKSENVVGHVLKDNSGALFGPKRPSKEV